MSHIALKELPSGDYILRHVKSGRFIGTQEQDGPIGAPDKVVLLPGGTQAQHFFLGGGVNNLYHITLKGHTAIGIDGKVYIAQHEPENPPKWLVTSIPEPNIGFRYTIKTTHPTPEPITAQWTVDKAESYTQVSLSPALVNAEDAVFELIPIAL